MDAYREFLGDTEKYDNLGVLNGFRALGELYVRQLVDDGKWFTVCHKIDPKQEDIMAIQNDKGVKLGTLISEIYPESVYRSAIYRYLLKNFLCYMEVPTVSFQTDTGTMKQSFKKQLVTANLPVMANWLGVTLEDVEKKYGSRVYSIDIDDGDDLLPYVKLVETKESVRKISSPRNNIDVGERGTRVIPVCFLKAGVDLLYNRLKSSVVKVSFLKDGGQFRDIITTFDFPKIKEIYGEGSFLEDSIMFSFNGDFLGSHSLSRGYIKVPEVGGSRYEDPTRSINYARIVEIQYDVEPELAFINIDLSVVVPEFRDRVIEIPSKSEDIINMLIAFGIDGGCWDVTQKNHYASKSCQSLVDWVDSRDIILTTVFRRELCLFMLANPQWFDSFTGEPNSRVAGSGGDVGLM